ncbi:MAG TPA: ATP-binding protein [Candidatus Nanoarchaeia archaeon]|nr:ATP-binding protein [Candidatus Nanoarchaeia archaeon]
MEELNILRILNKYNPWWSNKDIPPSKINEFKRGDFYVIKKLLEKREIISIIGPRRVGKTIMMHQLIKDLLSSGVDAKRILYLSVDEIELKNVDTQFSEILDTYSKYVIKTPLDSLNEVHYLFLDEIQEVPDWGKILKNWYDLGYNIKFVISGSSSIWITKGTEESLLGRISSTIMMPLKFSEVLRYKGIIPQDSYKKRAELKEGLMGAVQKDDYTLWVNSLKDFAGYFTPLKEKIQIELHRYLTVGGYPEFLDEEDYTKISEAIRDKIKLIFFKDIVRYFRIRNPDVLEDLFKLISKDSGGSFNLAKTAELLDIQRPTLRDYLNYLTKAYLIQSSQFYSVNRKKRIRKQDKVYVLDAGIRNGIIDYLDENLIKDEGELGRVVEGVLFDHLIRFKFNLERGPEPEIFYWKGKKEIDFVLQVKRKPIPIESKFRKKISGEVYDSIELFLSENNSPFGIVVTKDDFKIRDKIIDVPLWIFLLMV